MKYIALLRGVNVGGNSMIKMSEIQTVLEKAGYRNVRTYINSGNIIFESIQQDSKKLTKHIENLLQENFFAITVVIFSEEELKTIIAHAPSSWKKDDVRKYVAFITDASHPKEVIKEIQCKEDVDFIDIGDRVIYMTTKMSGLTKSNFSKLASKKIYKVMTIRNYNTVQKLATLLQQ